MLQRLILPLLPLFLLGMLPLSACSTPDKAPPTWWSAEPSAESGNARLVVGPTFYDPTLGAFDGLLIDRDGAIAGHWTRDQPVPTATVETLPGALSVPGLHDAHLHVEGIGRLIETVQLRGSRSVAEVNEKVAAFAAAHPEVPVIYGRGWDQSRFDPAVFPRAADLTAAPERPVVLSRVGGHAIWANAKALEVAGFAGADTKDIEGGEIQRDDQGVPTGIFVDNAEEALKAALAAKMPPTTDADRRRWLRAGLQSCADRGLTAVHDMGMSPESYAVLKALDQAETLPVRVFVYLDGTKDASYALLGEAPGRRVEVRGVKLYADGAMGSRGAALLEPYSDRPDHAGLMLTEPKLLEERARKAHAANKQVAIHAIGDRGVREALHAIGGAQGGTRTARHRVEHAQLVHKNDFEGFVRLGTIASMQPTHATSDMRWAEQRVGPERIVGAYAWRTMLDKKIPLAFGSDAPVESERVAGGLYAALTRQDGAGKPAGGWRPEQKVSLDEALLAFSLGAAYAAHAEDRLGSFAVGHRFDASLFASDPRTSVDAWRDAQVAGTVVDGQVRSAAPPQ